MTYQKAEVGQPSLAEGLTPPLPCFLLGALWGHLFDQPHS